MLCMDIIEAIKQWAMDNYENGGDVIVEAFSDAEIAETFTSLDDAKEFCGVRKEYADDIRASAF